MFLVVLKTKKTLKKPSPKTKDRSLTEGVPKWASKTFLALLTTVTAKTCARNLLLSCFSWSFKPLPVWTKPLNTPKLFRNNICTGATVKRRYCENCGCAHLPLFQAWSTAGSRKHIRSSNHHSKSSLLLRKTKIMLTFWWAQTTPKDISDSGKYLVSAGETQHSRSWTGLHLDGL